MDKDNIFIALILIPIIILLFIYAYQIDALQVQINELHQQLFIAGNL